MVGFPERADDVYNAAARARRRPGGGGLPQDVPAQLRRLRRAALLPDRPEPGAVRARRRARRASRSARTSGSPARRPPTEALAGAQVIVNLSASPYHAGKGARARADAGPARARQPRRGGLLQPGRRPGRAGLRRPQPGDRPGRRGGGPRAAVRGGARPSATVDPGAAGRRRACATRATAPACAGAASAGATPASRSSSALAELRRRRRARRGARAVAEPLLEPEAEVYAALVTRACATTWTRTASSAWCSALSGGIDSALVGADRGRRAGRRARDLRVDALALLVRGHAGRRARDRREPRHRLPGARRSRTR